MTARGGGEGGSMKDPAGVGLAITWGEGGETDVIACVCDCCCNVCSLY